MSDNRRVAASPSNEPPDTAEFSSSHSIDSSRPKACGLQVPCEAVLHLERDRGKKESTRAGGLSPIALDVRCGVCQPCLDDGRWVASVKVLTEPKHNGSSSSWELLASTVLSESNPEGIDSSETPILSSSEPFVALLKELTRPKSVEFDREELSSGVLGIGNGGLSRPAAPVDGRALQCFCNCCLVDGELASIPSGEYDFNTGRAPGLVGKEAVRTSPLRDDSLESIETSGLYVALSS